MLMQRLQPGVPMNSPVTCAVQIFELDRFW